jgi:hypothetical protein
MNEFEFEPNNRTNYFNDVDTSTMINMIDTYNSRNIKKYKKNKKTKKQP